MTQRGYKKSFKLTKKRINYKKILLCFVLVGIVSGAAYLFLFSAYFKIKEINVNSKEVAKEDVKRAISSQIEVMKNIFLANTGRAAKILKDQFPKIANAQIKRSFPDKINIEIEERKPIAVFEFNNVYFNLDKEGVAFEKVPMELVYLPLIKIQLNTNELKEGDSILTSANVVKLATIIDKFSNSLKIEINSINIVSDYRANIKTSEGWEAYISLDNDIVWQMEKLDTLLKEKIPLKNRTYLKYIDLRFDKVYVFPEISSLKNPTEK